MGEWLENNWWKLLIGAIIIIAIIVIIFVVSPELYCRSLSVLYGLAGYDKAFMDISFPDYCFQCNKGFNRDLNLNPIGAISNAKFVANPKGCHMNKYMPATKFQQAPPEYDTTVQVPYHNLCKDAPKLNGYNAPIYDAIQKCVYCPTGTKYDFLTNQCWKCPNDFPHEVLFAGTNAPNKCAKEAICIGCPTTSAIRSKPVFNKKQCSEKYPKFNAIRNVCHNCRSGYNIGAFVDKCLREGPCAGIDYDPKVYNGPFYDIGLALGDPEENKKRQGCWSCNVGYNRTVLPPVAIDEPNACHKIAYEPAHFFKRNLFQ